MPAMHLAMEREMAEGSYNQFCPVAMAAEILCTIAAVTEEEVDD